MSLNEIILELEKAAEEASQGRSGDLGTVDRLDDRIWQIRRHLSGLRSELLKKKAMEEMLEQASRATPSYTRPRTMYDNAKSRVYATGNKWAIENFEATH